MKLELRQLHFYVLLISVSTQLQAADTILGPQPEWDERLNFQEIEHRLKTEAIKQTTDIRDFLRKSGKVPTGIHMVKIIVLESGLKAVMKGAKACYGEFAAYKAAKLMGMRIVPPTVLSEYKGQPASLQFFVASKIDLKRRSAPTVFKHLPLKEQSDKDVFYYVFGQWDTHSGNQIVAKDQGKYHLALIDNAGIIRMLVEGVKHHRMRGRVIFQSTIEKLKKLNAENVKGVWSHFYEFDPKRCDVLIRLTLERRDLLLGFAKTNMKIINDL